MAFTSTVSPKLIAWSSLGRVGRPFGRPAPFGYAVVSKFPNRMAPAPASCLSAAVLPARAVPAVRPF